MGIIAPTNNKYAKKPPAGSKKAMAEAMSYAANQYIASPLTGERVTQWQAVVDRLYKTPWYLIYKDSNLKIKKIMKPCPN